MRLKINTLIIFLTLFSLHSSCQSVQVSSGKIETYSKFVSKYIDPRDVYIWLPENYDGAKSFSVLYMNDGSMLFDTSQTWNKQEWKVDETLAILSKEKELKNCIVVGIQNGGNKRFKEYYPQKSLNYINTDARNELLKNEFDDQPLGDNYLLFITKELKPYIDKKYKTKSDQQNTFMAGSSMGGLISMYAICEYPEIFSSVACLSTHWVGSVKKKNDLIPESFLDYLKVKIPNPKNHNFYFDYGTKTLDSLYEPYQLKVDTIFSKKGYSKNNYKSLKFDGEDHSEKSWSKRLDIPFRFVLRKE